MVKKVIFLFSGQGSQYFNMASEFYEKDEIFTSVINEIDGLVHEQLGYSLVKIIFDPASKGRPFDRTLHSHPAIFMVEYALAKMLIGHGIPCDYCLGASLGEYVAAAIAGMSTPRDMVGLIIAQARILEKNCEKGTMMAVLDGFSKRSAYKDVARLEVCSINYENHYIVGGPYGRVFAAFEELCQKGVTAQVLPIVQGFHTKMLEPAKSEFLECCQSVKVFEPSLPILSSVKGGPLQGVPTRDYWWDVVRKPILFQQVIQAFTDPSEYAFIDVGPSGTLTNLVKNIIGNDDNVYPIVTPFKQGIKNLQIAKEKLRYLNADRNTPEVKNMTAFIFSGQGSQTKGMGAGLFDEFDQITKTADKILGYSIKDLCVLDPEGKLGQTQYTQPALYTVNYLLYLKEVKKSGVKPDYVAGHSLGEYVALCVAEVFDFETGLSIVKKRGELMSKTTGGGMGAILGLSAEKIRQTLIDASLESIDIANYNSPEQIIISGKSEDVLKAQKLFENGEAKGYVPLQVSGAFHSRYMQEAKDEFAQFLAGFQFAEPKIPVISNYTGLPYEPGKVAFSMTEQMTGSVQWVQSVRYLMGKGLTDLKNYKEFSPNPVLTGMVFKITKQMEPYIPQEQHNTETTKLTSKGHGVEGQSLGSAEFKKDYNLRYAYIAGGMYKGIASTNLVVAVCRSGMLGFFGSGGLKLTEVEKAIQEIQKQLPSQHNFGMNLICNLSDPDFEEKTVDLYLKYGVRIVEASAFMQVTTALVLYRVSGLKKTAEGTICENKIIGKVSRPEVAEAFLSPPPERLVKKLLDAGRISSAQAELAAGIPMVDDIIVEADSAGHTDMGVAYVLMPAMILLRDRMMKQYGYKKNIRIGAAGGIGTPEAAAAAFVLGADFIVTGSINQCTVESGISETVKDMLQEMNVQDTEYAPAGDMFEVGAKVQVLRRGVFFPARANKLYDLYRQHNSVDEIDEKTSIQIQEKYFQKSFEEVWAETKTYYAANHPKDLEKAEKNPKQKMALIFKWYFVQSSRLARNGITDRKVDFQVHCGPALGAFNQWVLGSEMEKWQNRNVDQIGIKLMASTDLLLRKRLSELKV